MCCVIAPCLADGSEKPIGFVLRTLTDTEKKYSQVEKEGLAPSSNVSPQASGRIQRWSLKLAMYQYTLQFCPTTQHGNANALSRLPLPETLDTVPLPGELVLLIDHLAEGPIIAAQLKARIAKDPLLTKVL